MSNKIYWETLDKKRQKIFEQLSFVNKKGFYLAGGTALALRLGHRTSLDFDFYCQRHFKKGQIRQLIKKHFPKSKIKVIQDADDTFEVIIDGINISFFYYHYPLLKKVTKINKINIASLEDIAAMKVIAISQRGSRRGFIDIFYLLKIYSLEEILNLTQRKFREFDIYHGLKCLTYFVDADNDSDIKRVNVFDQVIKWQMIKKEIFKKVREFQSKYLKK